MAHNKEIQSLFNNPEDSYVIHYSYLDVDSSDGVFKKIISIHATNLDSSDSKEFSIDKHVLKNDIPLDDIDDWLDEVELIVLDDFNSFLREKSNCKFIFYGEDSGQGLILNELERVFEARNRADSNKQFKEIATSNRKSIFYLFQFDSQDKSLKDFIKLHNNNNLPASFLTNGGEGACFERRQFNKVRTSIICKIDFIIKLLNSNKSSSNTNGTTNAPVDLENLKPAEIFKHMNMGSWVLFLGGLIAIFSLGIWVNSMVSSYENNQQKFKIEKLIETVKKNKTDLKQRETVLTDSINNSNQIKSDILKNIYEAKIDSVKNHYKPIK